MAQDKKRPPVGATTGGLLVSYSVGTSDGNPKPFSHGHEKGFKHRTGTPTRVRTTPVWGTNYEIVKPPVTEA